LKNEESTTAKFSRFRAEYSMKPFEEGLYSCPISTSNDASNMSAAADVLKPVPPEQRIYGGVDLFLLWAGANTCLATIFTGGLIAPQLGFSGSMIDILIASTIGGLLLGLIVTIGYREGLPTMVLTRRVVGVKPSYAASMLNAFQLVGWTAILLYVSAEAMATASSRLGFGEPLSSITFWVVVIGVVEAAYTALGPKSWVWLERIAVSTLLAVLAYEVYALASYGFGSTRLSATNLSGLTMGEMFWGFDMVLATAVSWAPLVADYARFAKSGKGAALGTWWGYAVTSYILYGIGALTAVVFNVYLGDPTQVLLKLGTSVATLYLFFIAVSAITTNFVNIYSAVVSTMNVFPRSSFHLLVGLYGGLSMLLALTQLLIENFEWFLLYIGLVFVPLTTITIMRYTLFSRSGSTIPGLLSWLLGSAAGLAVTLIYGYGSTVVSLIASAVLYAVLNFALKPGRGSSVA